VDLVELLPVELLEVADGARPGDEEPRQRRKPRVAGKGMEVSTVPR
jgi:hypothetical protein